MVVRRGIDQVAGPCHVVIAVAVELGRILAVEALRAFLRIYARRGTAAQLGEFLHVPNEGAGGKGDEHNARKPTDSRPSRRPLSQHEEKHEDGQQGEIRQEPHPKTHRTYPVEPCGNSEHQARGESGNRSDKTQHKGRCQAEEPGFPSAPQPRKKATSSRNRPEDESKLEIRQLGGLGGHGHEDCRR